MEYKKEIIIRKASGKEESFDINKLERSLKNAGSSSETISEILKNINAWIYPGVSTKQIYSKAFAFLRRDRNFQSIPYKLKHAFLELGATGYPFEKLIGELFNRQGYSCEIGKVVQGRCITHEMDVIATRDNLQHLAECKYRHDQGKQISIQVPLYVNSRVNDIIAHRSSLPEYKGINYKAWVITNTRFSEDSINYAKCIGMHLLGWDYPHGNGLKEQVEQHRLYPVSILVGLTSKEKQSLLHSGILSCKQLYENIDELKRFDISAVKKKRLVKELNELCG